MEVIFRVDQGPARGAREVKLPNTITTHGQPILPAPKDVVYINNVPYRVLHIEWRYEESRVYVYVRRDYDIKFL